MKKLCDSGILLVCGLLFFAGAAQADIQKQMETTKIDVSLENATLIEALELICAKGKIQLTTMNMPANVPPLNLKMNDVSVLDAIKMVTKLAGVVYFIDANGVQVSSKQPVQNPKERNDNPFREPNPPGDNHPFGPGPGNGVPGGVNPFPEDPFAPGPRRPGVGGRVQGNSI